MTNSNHLGQPVSRGLLGCFFDRIVSWLLGFPPERCTYTTQSVRIPISNGLSRIELAASLLQPSYFNAAKPLGTVLFRSPYGRGLPIGITPRAYAARGYQVLLVCSRGTFGSGGEFDAFRDEVQDGKGVVEWMRQQPWYTGTFATCGGSYLGYVQWALLYDPPQDLVAAVPCVSPHNFARVFWDTGALNLDILKWADLIAHQEEPFSLWQTLTSSRSRRFKAVIEGVPLAPGIDSYFGVKTPWLNNVLAKPDLSEPYYKPMQLEQALERTDIPVLIITGWYDIFFEQAMEQYIRLKERGCNVALTVGPWAHIKSGLVARMHRQGFDWIEDHLGGCTEAKRTDTVQYFVTGAQEWRNISAYPPRTVPSTFYLHEGGKLKDELASIDFACSTFMFDPQKPTPTFGGNGLLTGGSTNDSALARRGDVLVFDTAPLEEDIEFCGKPTIHLAHSTNNAFADVFVRISEVDKKGRSHNITEVFQRLDPKRNAVAELNLDLIHCAHRFLRGRRIRVIVAGGNFPQYARNLGLENADDRSSEMCAVQHTIHHDVLHMSRIMFPVVVADSK
jgi:putative CocE/NonD family hydrolase